MKIKVIKTEAENELALKEVEKLMTKATLTKEEDERLELLYILIENFENKAYPIPAPDPIEAIKFCMEQRGLTRADLIKELGDKSKVSQILNKQRGLSISMIRNLSERWNIPAQVLIAPYKLKSRNRATSRARKASLAGV